MGSEKQMNKNNITKQNKEKVNAAVSKPICV